MDNLFFVGAQGGHVVAIRPVPQRMTNEEALNLAAWIVAIVGEEKFQEVYKKVCST